MDNTSPAKRRRVMQANKSNNTKPEVALRKKLHAHGLRFRLHNKKLPGCPDITLPKYKTVIMVNGCFWHQHTNCPRAHWPQSRQEYWEPKLKRNIERDSENREKLLLLGWKVIVVWECQIGTIDEVTRCIAAELKTFNP